MTMLEMELGLVCLNIEFTRFCPLCIIFNMFVHILYLTLHIFRTFEHVSYILCIIKSLCHVTARNCFNVL